MLVNDRYVTGLKQCFAVHARLPRNPILHNATSKRQAARAAVSNTYISRWPNDQWLTTHWNEGKSLVGLQYAWHPHNDRSHSQCQRLNDRLIYVRVRALQLALRPRLHELTRVFCRCVCYSRLVRAPLMATLKPQSNGTSYSNTVIGALAVDGWAVTFSTARKGRDGLRLCPVPSSTVPNVTAHPSTASVPTSYYSMQHYICLWSVKG